MSTLRNRYQESKITIKRLSLVVFCFIVLYAILIARLYQLQIKEHTYYLNLSEKNKNREVYIAPYRADIVDRNGEALATYETKFKLNILEALSLASKEKLLEKGVPLSDKSKYELTSEQFAYFSNYTPKEVNLEAIAYRYYPLGEASAHIIGYTGHMHHSEYSYVDQPLEGKSGIEKRYQSELFGEAGILRQHKNAKGELFNTDILTEAKRATAIEMTIDARLQSYVYNLMLGCVGAAIVLDPNTGEILAAVSSPSYDPNAISKSDYSKRLVTTDKPMFNRITQGLYPPGSIVKPFIALGAMENNLLDPDACIEDPGFFKLNDNSKVFHDHKRTGHGKVNLHRAIAVSCDTYFYHLAQKLGIDRMVKYLQTYKLSEKNRY